MPGCRSNLTTTPVRDSPGRWCPTRPTVPGRSSVIYARCCLPEPFVQCMGLGFSPARLLPRGALHAARRRGAHRRCAGQPVTRTRVWVEAVRGRSGRVDHLASPCPRPPRPDRDQARPRPPAQRRVRGASPALTRYASLHEPHARLNQTRHQLLSHRPRRSCDKHSHHRLLHQGLPAPTRQRRRPWL
jgi:hypothetical protein